jgi:L-galactose dehydrogenase
MLMTTLGNTGLQVSRMGLGCGGHSRLGLRGGATTEEASRVVREAIDLGVNFIDTAEVYGTEEAVGLGISGVPRESVILSTKVGSSLHDQPATPAQTRERVENCLRRLKTDYVDILHLHGVMPDQYSHALNVLYPLLAELKVEGKVRHIGITEGFIGDPSHQMLGPAVQDGPWDVVMVGFSLLNPSARKSVLPHTIRRGIGTLCMFAVRRALSNREALLDLINELIQGGNKDVEPLKDDALDFLTAPEVACSLQQAAYRFCLWEPGIDVVLSGTGNIDHLRENVRSLQGPKLPDDVQQRLKQAFGSVDSVSGN